MRRVGYLAVVVTVEFHYFCVGMTDDLHHSPEVSIFFVAAEEFEFAIAGDEEQWRGVFADVEEWREGVDDGLFAVDAAFFAHGEMRDGVAAEGDEAGDGVGVNLVRGEPARVARFNITSFPIPQYKDKVASLYELQQRSREGEA